MFQLGFKLGRRAATKATPVTPGVLAGSSMMQMMSTGTASRLRALAGSAIMTIVATGAVSAQVAVALVGAATMTMTSTGAVTRTRELSGSATMTMTSTGAVTQGGSQAFAFTDNFEGPDTALGERPMWTRAGGVSGGCATRSGKLSHFVSGGSDTAYYVETGYTKHRISAEVQQATNSTTLLIAGRLVDNTNYVALRRNSNQWQLYRVINGGFTLLGSSAQAVAVGDIIEISFDGDTVSTKRNGAEMIGTNLAMNAPTLANATKAGTVARTTFDPALDNVKIAGAA